MANLSELINNSVRNQSMSLVSSQPPIPASLFLFAMISSIVVGAFGQISGLFVAVVIFSSKSLRTPCFELIAGGALGSVMSGAHYFGRGMDKVAELTGTMMSPQRSVLTCLLTAGLHGMFGIPFHAIITCLIGIDRILSLAAPIKYRNFGTRYAIYMFSAAAIFCIGQEVIGFMTTALQKTVTCRSFVDAASPGYLYTFGALSLFFNVATVAVYGAMLFCFYKRKNSIQEGGTPMHAAFMKQQSAAMPTVKLMIVLYTLFGTFSEILINIVTKFDRTIYRWVDPIKTVGDFLKVCCTTIEFIALMAFSNKFRQCAKKLLGIKSETVAAVSSVKSGQNQRGV